MFNVLEARLQQKKRTIAYPKSKPDLPDRFRGRPIILRGICVADCRACTEACPTDAITRDMDGPSFDLGRCLFCGECVKACPRHAIQHTADYRMATRTREALVLKR